MKSRVFSSFFPIVAPAYSTYFGEFNSTPSPMQMFNSPIRIVIADDHQLFRFGIKYMLEQQKQKIQVVGEASNGKVLIEEVSRHKPDIVLTDIRMPHMDGLEASLHLSKNSPETKIIAITMIDEAEFVLQMLEVGVKGYLLKYAEQNEILDAIHSVHEGNYYYSNKSTSTLFSLLSLKKNDPLNINKNKFTQNESKVMKLICDQLTTKEIAAEMQVSHRTIEEYSKRLKHKTGSKSLVGIALYALKNKIVNFKD